VVVAVHQHLRLHHRHDALLLAQGRVAGQGVAVGLDAGTRGHVLADGDDGAPLGETGAQLRVLLQAVAQAVQALGDQLAGEAGQRHGALVDLDDRDHAGIGHHLGEGHAVAGGLADGLVIEDGAGDVVAQTRGGQQHFPVGAAVLLGALDADGLETLLDGVGGLIDGDDALARGHHGLGGLGELVDAHGDSGGVAGSPALYLLAPAPARNRGPPGPFHSPNGAVPRAQSTPRPSALPPAPTWSRRRVLVAPCNSMESPLVRMARSPSASRPALYRCATARAAASRLPMSWLSKSIGNTSRTSAIR